jgi:hypothetical protein
MSKIAVGGDDISHEAFERNNVGEAAVVCTRPDSLAWSSNVLEEWSADMTRDSVVDVSSAAGQRAQLCRRHAERNADADADADTILTGHLIAALSSFDGGLQSNRASSSNQLTISADLEHATLARAQSKLSSFELIGKRRQ